MESDFPSDVRPASPVSPFTAASVSIPRADKKGNSWLWLSLGLLVLVILAAGSYLVFRSVQNPYRTLTEFPVDKYFSGYRSLSGARFKATLRVESDLGFKPETGRLMSFSSQPDNRLLVVLIPPTLKDLYFTKGQSYTAEVEVGEGGLIHAYSFEKN